MSNSTPSPSQDPVKPAEPEGGSLGLGDDAPASPATVYDEFDVKVQDCQAVKEHVKLADLDKKKKFDKEQIPLVVEVSIEKFDLKAVSQILVVLNEKFVLSA